MTGDGAERELRPSTRSCPSTKQRLSTRCKKKGQNAMNAERVSDIRVDRVTSLPARNLPGSDRPVRAPPPPDTKVPTATELLFISKGARRCLNDSKAKSKL